MDLSSLLTYLVKLPEFEDLQEALFSGEPDLPNIHLPRSVRPAIAAGLAREVRKPILYLTSRIDRLRTLSEELILWNPDLRILSFPDPDPLFFEYAAWGERVRRLRVATLSALTSKSQSEAQTEEDPTGQPLLILASARAIMTRTLSPSDFRSNTLYLDNDQSIEHENAIRTLQNNGYTHASIVTSPGQFSRRGGILDIWPPAEPGPIRVEFFGDNIESLRRFDPASQRSTTTLDSITVSPAREGLPLLFDDSWLEFLPDTESEVTEPNYEYFLPWMCSERYGLLNYLDRSTLILFDDQPNFEQTVSEIEEQAISARKENTVDLNFEKPPPIPYLTLDDLTDSLQDHQILNFGIETSTIAERHLNIDQRFNSGPRFAGQLHPLMQHLLARRSEHENVVVVSRQAPRLAELWGESGETAVVHDDVPSDLVAGEVYFLQGALSEGWILKTSQDQRIHLLTDAEIFGWSRPKPRRLTRARTTAPEAVYSDLRSGDWVVHVDYGIGKFSGLVERILDDTRREYLLIEYAGGDQLYVPIHQADRLTRYVGVSGTTPSSSRLGTKGWSKAKGKAREAVEKIAKELLELYAQRQTVTGYAFSPDTPWQKELEASFPYPETDDQIRTLNAVKDDMESNLPMDRLICGDVGYGKTEVALRAAFKAVLDGKQVAMLVPTTVLAQQHFNTFRKRLSAFPVEVEMLSRFRTRSQAAEIVQRLSNGELDIIIGTHRLLQEDVKFKDLGVLIIDEEQRFGVTHKEHLKKMRTEVDVLTLTATPIPRTLYMALSGARDISTIFTPPEDRLPVITQVGPYDPKVIRNAILRELDRGGQVFFVHNRVQTIGTIFRRLERLTPEARFAVAHGQMPETELAEVMERFAAGEIDVLLSTSIIESGLDIPNANTLIVDRAEMFGLGQLYQLRGRVGRGAVQAYAYLLRHPHLYSSDEAFRRLEIIAEHSQLGAGYAIAMRDLEIRGAGDILGNRQHGQISAVGFHLFTRLLATTVRRMKSTMLPKDAQRIDLPYGEELPSITIELPLPSAIPDEYISNRDLRLQLYRRMAEIRSETELEALQIELNDRFGPIPDEVKNLVFQLRVKILAANAGVDSVISQDGKILIQFPNHQFPQTGLDLGGDIRFSKRGIWLTRSEDLTWPDRLLEILTVLNEQSKSSSSA